MSGSILVTLHHAIIAALFTALCALIVRFAQRRIGEKFDAPFDQPAFSPWRMLLFAALGAAGCAVFIALNSLGMSAFVLRLLLLPVVIGFLVNAIADLLYAPYTARWRGVIVGAVCALLTFAYKPELVPLDFAAALALGAALLPTFPRVPREKRVKERKQKPPKPVSVQTPIPQAPAPVATATPQRVSARPRRLVDEGPRLVEDAPRLRDDG